MGVGERGESGMGREWSKSGARGKSGVGVEYVSGERGEWSVRVGRERSVSGERA